MKHESSMMPEGENLRRAVQWLSENAPVSPATVNEAGLRFDLTPTEEEFLLREFTSAKPHRDE